MIRTAVMLLVLVTAASLLLDCKKDKPAQVEAVGSDMPTAEQPGATAMTEKETLIADVLLSRCIESKGAVVLVQVDRVEIKAKGTRSESAWFKATVNQTVYGAPEPRIEFWCTTSKGKTVLTEGRTYIVAVSGSGENWVPGTMMDYVPVRPGKEDATVNEHKLAVQRLLASE